jgi:hypothetical protein
LIFLAVIIRWWNFDKHLELPKTINANTFLVCRTLQMLIPRWNFLMCQTRWQENAFNLVQLKCYQCISRAKQSRVQ